MAPTDLITRSTIKDGIMSIGLMSADLGPNPPRSRKRGCECLYKKHDVIVIKQQKWMGVQPMMGGLPLQQVGLTVQFDAQPDEFVWYEASHTLGKQYDPEWADEFVAWLRGEVETALNAQAYSWDRKRGWVDPSATRANVTGLNVLGNLLPAGALHTCAAILVILAFMILQGM